MRKLTYFLLVLVVGTVALPVVELKSGIQAVDTVHF